MDVVTVTLLIIIHILAALSFVAWIVFLVTLRKTIAMLETITEEIVSGNKEN